MPKNHKSVSAISTVLYLINNMIKGDRMIRLILTCNNTAISERNQDHLQLKIDARRIKNKRKNLEIFGLAGAVSKGCLQCI